MRLVNLLSALPHARLTGPADVEITGLSKDSRQVRPGTLFVAYSGVNQDLHQFIPDAIHRGAGAIVAERPPQTTLPPGLPYLLVPNGRRALAALAAAWHGFPSRRLTVIGVTGTDGKTTTTTLIRAILEAAGYPTGMVSTVSATIGSEEIDTGFHTTTPDAPDIQGYLARMVAAGMTHAVLETTSHGLEQERVAAIDFDVAVVTNITHEHLDILGSWEAYRDAKARLFRYLMTTDRKPGTPRLAILNADDVSYDYLRAIPADRHIAYGLERPADVTAAGVTMTPAGLSFRAVTPVGNIPITSPLLGRFNLYNILAAVSVGVGLAIPAPALTAGVATVKGIIGRMERITLPDLPVASHAPDVIVDFAHTPNALKVALELARTLTRGRLWVVYGCAGLRDVGKRAMMGEVSGRLADMTVITAEDPRTEPVERSWPRLPKDASGPAGAKAKGTF